MLIFSHLIICNPHSRGKFHYSDTKLHRVQGLPKATCMRGEDLGPRDPLARNHKVTMLRSRISTRFCLILQTGSSFDGTNSLSFLPPSFHPSNTISCPLTTFEAQVKLTERTQGCCRQGHHNSSGFVKCFSAETSHPGLHFFSCFPHSLSLSQTEVVATASLAELQKDSKPHSLDPAVFNTFPELLLGLLLPLASIKALITAVKHSFTSLIPLFPTLPQAS